MTQGGREALTNLQRNGKEKEWELARLSAYTREQMIKMPAEIPMLYAENEDGPYLGRGAVRITDALASFPRTVSDRLDRTLLNLAVLSPLPGRPLWIRAYDLPIAFAENTSVFDYVIEQLKRAGYLTPYSGAQKKPDDARSGWEITAQGWDRVGELQRGVPGSRPDRAFVAMWFDKTVRPAYFNGIHPGIARAGFKPYRVDEQQSNDLLDDLILAGIRESRFMVADLTGHRPNTYVEAGFAMGLGLPVIFTCKKIDFDDGPYKGGPFDINHYPLILWEKPEDIPKQLTPRIVATIDIGPGPRPDEQGRCVCPTVHLPDGTTKTRKHCLKCGGTVSVKVQAGT